MRPMQRAGVVFEPVVVEDRAEPEILDAGAAAVEPEPQESGGGDGQRRERGAGRVDERLEPGAGVRHTDQHDPADLARPATSDRQAPTERPHRAGVVASRANDEPAHAVADQVDLAHPHRPRPHEMVEEVGELAPVGGDVTAGVVPQRQHGHVVVVGEQRAVGGRPVVRESPDRLGRHQSVDEHADPRADVRDGGGQNVGQRLAVERQHRGACTNRHRDREP